LTARSFTKRWLAGLLGLTLLALAFPFLLPPLVYATNCKGVGGACGAIAVVFGIYLRLPIVIGIGIYLAVVGWKRSRTLGLLPWGFVFILLNYIAASPLLFGFGNFWGARFALGVPGGDSLPAFGFLLAGLIGLSFLSYGEASRTEKRARTATLAAGGVALLIMLPTTLGGLTLLPWIAGVSLRSLRYALLRPLLHLVGPHFSFLVLAAFVVSLTWWVRSADHSKAGAEIA
jgi:hypothetical protein